MRESSTSCQTLVPAGRARGGPSCASDSPTVCLRQRRVPATIVRAPSSLAVTVMSSLSHVHPCPRCRKGPWHMSKTIATGVCLTNSWLAEHGMLSLRRLWAALRRTAICGPTCTLVWGGPAAMVVLTRLIAIAWHHFTETRRPRQIPLGSGSLRTSFTVLG